MKLREQPFSGRSWRDVAWDDNYLFMEFALRNLMEMGASDDDLRDEFERALENARKNTEEWLDWESQNQEHE